jgi:hypothetical protein
MTTYFLAPSLAALRDELNAAFPKRDHASDGWIGDASHQAESYSDHNPCWSCGGQLAGVVRALDIDSGPDGDDKHDLVQTVLQATIGDPRTWYVIWQGKIYSRTYGWAPRVYTGPDPHINHVHVSIQGHNLTPQDGAAAVHAAEDTSKWLNRHGPVLTLPSVLLTNAVHAARHPHHVVNPVAARRIQRALNAHGMGQLQVDGQYGRTTRAAYKRWQQHAGYSGHDADGIPGMDSLTRLGANRFRVV